MAVGLVISLLSFYILLLSIYLLLQKNTDKLENLILIGYGTSRVAMPYQILTVVINLMVLVLSVIIMVIVRGIYTDALSDIITGTDYVSIAMSCVFGLILFILVSVYNIIAIRRKIGSIL